MPTEATVFVVDDDDSVRRSVQWLLESVGLDVATYADAESFLAAYDGAQPGCLVLDVRMPGASGLDLQLQLKERGLLIPVILVTGHADVPMAIRAMKAGAFDFIEKPFNDQRLLDRIHAAIESDARARLVHEEMQRIEARIASLTPREREVLDAVVAGDSNKQIANNLSVGIKTVEAHRAHMMAKMQARSVSELVRLAISRGVAEGKP